MSQPGDVAVQALGLLFQALQDVLVLIGVVHRAGHRTDQIAEGRLRGREPDPIQVLVVDVLHILKQVRVRAVYRTVQVGHHRIGMTLGICPDGIPERILGLADTVDILFQARPHAHIKAQDREIKQDVHPCDLDRKELPGALVHGMLPGSGAHPHETMPEIIAETGQDVVPLPLDIIRRLLERVPELLDRLIDSEKLLARPPKAHADPVGCGYK